MQAKNFTLAIGAAVGAALMLSGTAKAISLDTLISAGPGNMIVVGNVVYSNFTYGGILPSNVAITTTANGLAFTTTTGGFTTPSGSAVISYDITVTGNNVQSVGLDFTAIATGGASAFVGETVTDLVANKDYPLQVFTDGPGGLPDTNTASVTLNPGSNTLHVVKSIDVASAGTGSATITLVDNTFTQGGGAPPPVPEPMSLALLPLALLGLSLRKKLLR